MPAKHMLARKDVTYSPGPNSNGEYKESEWDDGVFVRYEGCLDGDSSHRDKRTSSMSLYRLQACQRCVLGRTIKLLYQQFANVSEFSRTILYASNTLSGC